MESCRAKSSENKSKNCKNHIFHVCFSFCGYLLWAPAPHKTWRTSSKKKKQQHGLIRFSFAWKPFCNDLEVNRARGDREIRLWKMSGGAPSFWLVPGSIPWTPKNARERSQERQFSFSALALLTTPQKHLRIASYKLWSHSGSNQARTSRKTAKITFFHVFSRVFTCTSLVFDQKFKI